MLKNIKKIISCVFLITIILINTNVKAITEEEYNKNSGLGGEMSFPFTIWNGEGTMTVYISDYTLYYQVVQLNDTQYNNIMNKIEEVNSEVEASKDVLELERTALIELEDTLEPGDQEALDEYNARVQQYNESVAQHNQNVKDKQLGLINMYPTFDVNSWTLSEDRGITVPTEFEGERKYVVWAKLVKSDSSVLYDAQIYTVDGTLAEEENIPVTTITITGGKYRMDISEQTMQLGVEITPSDATNKKVIWSSSNDAIATVDQTGKVTAKSVGTVTISVTTEDGQLTKDITIAIVSWGETGEDSSKNYNNVSDETTAKEPLPKAGSIIFTGLFIMVITSGIVGYIKYKKLNII